LKTAIGKVSGLGAAVPLAAEGSMLETGKEAFWDVMNFPLVTFGQSALTPWNITGFILIFVVGFTLGTVYKKKVLHKEGYFHRINISSRTLVANLGYYAIIALTLLFALNMLGLDFTSLTVVAGALSIGIGFGLQNIVSNFISGIILVFEKSIRVGDYIEVSDQFRGTVSDIRMRSVSVTTNDGVEVLVPNQTFIQHNVINWTLSDDMRRLHIPFSVAYGTKVEDVKRAILKALEKTDHPYIRDDSDKRPIVWMTGMGASGVEFSLVLWISGKSTVMPSTARSDFLILVYEALYEAGITIPFPQLDLHIKDSAVNGKTGI